MRHEPTAGRRLLPRMDQGRAVAAFTRTSRWCPRPILQLLTSTNSSTSADVRVHSTRHGRAWGI